MPNGECSSSLCPNTLPYPDNSICYFEAGFETKCPNVVAPLVSSAYAKICTPALVTTQDSNHVILKAFLCIIYSQVYWFSVLPYSHLFLLLLISVLCTVCRSKCVSSCWVKTNCEMVVKYWMCLCTCDAKRRGVTCLTQCKSIIVKEYTEVCK